jgi:Lanthionine synthetase C-like protein
MMTTSRAWSPLLSGDAAAAVLAAVEAIAADLAATASLIAPFGPDSEFSLARGTAGQALFLAYLDAVVPERGYGGLGRDLLRQAVEVAVTRSGAAAFYTGVSGVAWTVEHLWGRRCTDVAGEEPWEGEALDLAWQACDHDLAERGVVDAGLRHGVAGRAHLLNRLFQATGKEPFADTARAGFCRLLEMRRPGEGIGGFRTRVSGADGRPVWTDDPGLLDGSAGIGLALLAAVSAVEPAWDRLLLAWLQPRRDPEHQGGAQGLAAAHAAAGSRRRPSRSVAPSAAGRQMKPAHGGEDSRCGASQMSR